jgi:hypothetical protein
MAKKTHLRIFIFMFILISSFYNCNIDFSKGNKNDSNIDLKAKEEDLISLTRSFSKSIKNPEIMNIVYIEIGKQFDGDTEVLFKTLSEKKLASGQNVYEVLKNEFNRFNDAKDYDQVIESLKEAVSNLQIYMMNFSSWDGKTLPMVGYIPFTFDEEAAGYIYGYDDTGKEYQLTKSAVGKKPLLIIGPNERCDNSGSVRNDFISVDLSMASDTPQKIDIQNIAGGISKSTATSNTGGYYEGADIYCDSLYLKNDYDSWRGKSEIRILFKPGISTFTGQKRIKLDGFGEGDTRQIGAYLFPWYQDTYGTCLYYFIYELDNGEDEMGNPKGPVAKTYQVSANPVKTLLGDNSSDLAKALNTITGTLSMTFDLNGNNDFVDNGWIDCRRLASKNQYGDDNTVKLIMRYVPIIPCSPDDKPIPKRPEGDSTNQNFKWLPCIGADFYTIYIYKSSNNALVDRINNIASTGTDMNSYTLTRGLPKNIQLYWNIKGIGSCGEGPLSDNMEFKIIDNGGGGTIQSFGVTGGSLPVFTWPSGASCYWLLVSDNPDVGSGNWVIDQRELTSAIFISTQTFSPGTYYWKVKYKEGDISNWYWSSIYNFTVE